MYWLFRTHYQQQCFNIIKHQNFLWKRGSNNLSSKQGNMYCSYDRWLFFFLYSLCCGWWLWSHDGQLPLCCVLWWMCLRSSLQHMWHIPDRHITKWNEMAGKCDCLHKPLLYPIHWSLSNAHSTQLWGTADVIIVPADILASLSAGTHCDYHHVSFANMLWVIDVFFLASLPIWDNVIQNIWHNFPL